MDKKRFLGLLSLIAIITLSHAFGVTSLFLKAQAIDEIIHEIEFSSKEIGWDEFELRFREVHAQFYDNYEPPRQRDQAQPS